MKLQTSPASEPRNGWIDTLDRVRVEIEDVLRDSPSLRRELPAIITREMVRARRFVERDLDSRGEATKGLDGLTFDVDQMLGLWLPD